MTQPWPMPWSIKIMSSIHTKNSSLKSKSRFNEMFGDVILNEKEWKVSKWNEILTIRNGKNQKQVEDADGKFPIYGSGGIMGYAKDWIVKKNSVIIGRKGNINKPILVRENFWNVDTAFGLEPVLEKINSEYLFYFCQLYNFEKLNKAVTIPSLTKSDLLNISIPLPPLALQNEFADFVALVDKSRFNEMFGENKIFESIDNLFDIIDGDRGKNYPKSDELFSEEYCLFLNTKNVTKNGFSFDTKQFITKTKDKLLRKGKLERYDIVLTTRGTVGNVAYYDELIKYKHLRINSGMVILRPKTPNLNQKFIIHVLRNNNYSRVISGSAQPQLPITKLKKILLPLPPLALQNEFADFVVQVDKSQFACEIAIKVWRNSLKFSII
ncbi:restriction endonuclease subunit S [Streptococcus pneumoniae]|nr:restriction endonuclease subunit S [Streptococcus pneumoniae]